MESAIILTAVFFAVAIPLYLCTLSATAYRDGVKESNRDDELMAEIEKLDKALTYSAREVATLRLDLAVANQNRDKILEVARTTLGYVQTFTGNGFSYRKPFGEKIPEWDDDTVEPMEGWELIRKELEAVLPKV